MKQVLFIIYNADKGLFSQLTDFAHKIISPTTYSCSLCALTHGNFSMRQEWADYLSQLPLEVKFVYRNEWEHASLVQNFPLIALQNGEGKIKILLDALELNQIRTLDGLKAQIDAALLRERI
ncbi:hypothetical protein ACSX1A_10075 [Pontibacter sp. MBLB2868]|uniref:hypothetical protein n=1 Tax=Pontibacter sp. MBLB2868 TaxID=3451555 RepID=UPI003F74C6AF